MKLKPFINSTGNTVWSPITSLVSLVVLASAISSPVSAGEVLELQGRAFEQNPTVLETPKPALRAAFKAFSRRAARGGVVAGEVVLPPLSPAERSTLQQTAQDEEKAFHIGVGRSANIDLGQPANWDWSSVDGGLAAHVSLTSTGAKQLRAQLKMGALPAGVELRFYSPNEPDAVYGPYTAAKLSSQPKDASGNTLSWTPVVAGETLKMEVFLPSGVQPESLALQVPQVSHLVVDPISGELESNTLKSSMVSCQLDVACAAPTWQQEASAVAAYYMTDAQGRTGYCSGTLLNNAREDATPYFLTANHCVKTEQEAASVVPVWFFSNSACGGSDAKQRSMISAMGATLLVTGGAVDTTLLRLYDKPTKEQGRWYAGWSANPLSYQNEVTGIHHSSEGDGVYPKKVSQGYVTGFAGDLGEAPLADSGKAFAVVQWTHGVTAKGSSGSGLWVDAGGQPVLKGTLKGGDSSCNNPTGFDWYARFDKAYPLLKPWLNPAP